MKKMSLFQNVVKSILVLFVLFFTSCSNDDNDSAQEEPTNTIDLAAVEGKYVGTWFWTPGDSPISMEITKSGGSENRFSVKFYESSNFKPSFNLDGNTPEATGLLDMDGDKAEIDLKLDTDFPVCKGDYTGNGTKDENGKLTLDMNIVHDCGADGTATFSLRKISD